MVGDLCVRIEFYLKSSVQNCGRNCWYHLDQSDREACYRLRSVEFVRRHLTLLIELAMPELESLGSDITVVLAAGFYFSPGRPALGLRFVVLNSSVRAEQLLIY